MRSLDQEDEEEDDIEIDLDTLPDNNSEFGLMPKLTQVEYRGHVVRPFYCLTFHRLGAY